MQTRPTRSQPWIAVAVLALTCVGCTANYAPPVEEIEPDRRHRLEARDSDSRWTMAERESLRAKYAEENRLRAERPVRDVEPVDRLEPVSPVRTATPVAVTRRAPARPVTYYDDSWNDGYAYEYDWRCADRRVVPRHYAPRYYQPHYYQPRYHQPRYHFPRHRARRFPLGGTLLLGTLGGVIGHQSGHRDEGILIGAGVGLLHDLFAR